MFCPRCHSVQLAVAHYQDIEIDHCEQCHGIWLDKNELQKIIEKETADRNGDGGGDSYETDLGTDYASDEADTLPTDLDGSAIADIGEAAGGDIWDFLGSLADL